MLADGHRLFLEGLKAILEPQFDVIGSASDRQSLLREAVRLNPDLVLLNIAMPQLNGIEAARQRFLKAN